MRRLIFSILFLLFLSFSGCEKKDPVTDSILNTRWSLSKLTDNLAGTAELFPGDIEKVTISFDRYGILGLTGLCNFTWGTYSFAGNDLTFSTLGPATKKYCFPSDLMEWESLFINSLCTSGSYCISNDQLVIHCSGNRDLVFDFVDSSAKNTGKLLFYTNSGVNNCPFSIRLSLNNTVVDTLTAASTFYGEGCFHGYKEYPGLSFDLKPGIYSYFAKEEKCCAVSQVKSWSGEVEIREGKCPVVFLNVLQ